MTSKNRIPAAAALALLAAGCASVPADVPQEALHAPSAQKTSRALHHWNVLAADVAAHVAGRLSDWPPDRHPLHVEVAPQASGFDQGFRELLVTQLVERGVAVAAAPSDVRLHVATRLVQHHADAPLVSHGEWLADGVRVHRGAGEAHDGDGPLRSEVLVVTSLESEGRILVRTSDMYTIAQDDAPLYLPPRPAPATAPLKTWRVTP